MQEPVQWALESSAQNFSNGIPLEETVSASKIGWFHEPKDSCAAIIPTPIYDQDTWRPNDFVIPTSINDQKTQELFQNGYVVTNDTVPASAPLPYLQPASRKEVVKETYPGETYESPTTSGYGQLDYPAVDFSCGYQPLIQELKFTFQLSS